MATDKRVFTLRLSDEVFDKIGKLATDDHRSMTNYIEYVLLFEDDMSPDSVRKLCDAVAQVCGGRCAVFAGADGAFKYAIGQVGGDLRALTKELNAALSGRGGGKPNFVQGSVNTTREAIEKFFAASHS